MCCLLPPKAAEAPAHQALPPFCHCPPSRTPTGSLRSRSPSRPGLADGEPRTEPQLGISHSPCQGWLALACRWSWTPCPWAPPLWLSPHLASPSTPLRCLHPSLLPPSLPPAPPLCPPPLPTSALSSPSSLSLSLICLLPPLLPGLHTPCTVQAFFSIQWSLSASLSFRLILPHKWTKFSSFLGTLSRLFYLRSCPQVREMPWLWEEGRGSQLGAGAVEAGAGRGKATPADCAARMLLYNGQKRIPGARQPGQQATDFISFGLVGGRPGSGGAPPTLRLQGGGQL